jgi:hypothetical protein
MVAVSRWGMHCDPTLLSVHFRSSIFLISQSSEFGTSRKLGPHSSEFGTMISHPKVMVGWKINQRKKFHGGVAQNEKIVSWSRWHKNQRTKLMVGVAQK